VGSVADAIEELAMSTDVERDVTAELAEERLQGAEALDECEEFDLVIRHRQLLAAKDGFLGAEAGETLLNDLLHAKD
jgi:hypothetical protein